jgi:hypothetical protein
LGEVKRFDGEFRGVVGVCAQAVEGDVEVAPVELPR